MSEESIASGAPGSLRTPLRTEALVTGLICLALIAYVGESAYVQDLATLAVTYSFLALGMYLPLALGGQLSLAYNAYFAIGAYSVALLAQLGQFGLWAAIPAGIAASMATASLLAYVTRRLSGFHLAVATLMFGIAVQTWLIHTDSVTGGPAGLGGVPRLSVFGWTLDRTQIVIVGVMGVWIVATLIGRFRVSLAGTALRLQREVPEAAKSSGVPVTPLRVYALAVGAAVASVGGMIFALVNQFVLPESFGSKTVFLVLFMPILGGMSSPWGAVIGAVLVVVFTLGFDLFQGPGALTFGILSLIVLLLAPSGLIGLGAAFGGWLKRKYFGAGGTA